MPNGFEEGVYFRGHNSVDESWHQIMDRHHRDMIVGGVVERNQNFAYALEPRRVTTRNGEELGKIREYRRLKDRWNSMPERNRLQSNDMQQQLEELTSDMLYLGEPL